MRVIRWLSYIIKNTCAYTPSINLLVAMKITTICLIGWLLGSMAIGALAQPTTVYVRSAWNNQAAVDADAGQFAGQPVAVPAGLTLNANAFATVQAAINAVASGGTVNVYVGAYAQNLTISKSLSLIGPNVGIAGFSPRNSEANLVPGTNNTNNGYVVTVQASNARIEGLRISGNNPLLTGNRNAVQGINVNGTAALRNNIVIVNNLLEEYPSNNQFFNPDIPGAAIYMRAAAAFPSLGNVVTGNLVRNVNFGSLNTETPLLGSGLILYDRCYAQVRDNRFENTGVGVGLYILPAPASPNPIQRIGPNVFDANAFGILSVNGPVALEVDSVTVTNSLSFGFRHARNGALEGADATAMLTIRHSTFAGGGPGLSNVTNLSGIAIETFEGNTGLLNTTIEDCIIRDNRNRGITFRGDDVPGRNVGIINRCRIEGNGYAAVNAGNAFGVIVNRGATVTINNSFLSNFSPSITTNTMAKTLGADRGNALTVANGGSPTAGGILTATNSFVDVPATDDGNGSTRAVFVGGEGSSAQLGFNWWGTTNPALLSNVSGLIFGNPGVDVTPWLVTGDADGDPTNGFQPDLSVVETARIRQQIGTSQTVIEEAANTPGVGEVRLRSVNSFNEPSNTITRSVRLGGDAGITINHLSFNAPSDTLAVVQSFTINNTLTIVNGLIRTGAQVLTLGSTGTLSETVTAFVEGRVRATRGLGGTLPVSSGFGGLLTLQRTGGNNPGSITVTRVTGEPLTGNAAPDETTQQTIARYFDLEPATTNTGLQIRLTFPYRDSEVLGTVSTLQLLRAPLPYVATGTQWTELATFIDESANILQTDGVDEFLTTLGRFTAIADDAPLPIVLAAFEAIRTGDDVRLRWETLSEINTDHFAVERSFDGETFELIGTVAADGQSRTSRHYQFTDTGVARLPYDYAYYRLRDVDTDGRSDVSDARRVMLTDEAPALLTALYPNPARAQVTLTLNAREVVELQVFDARGQLVATRPVRSGEVIDTRAYAPGLYVFRVNDRVRAETRRVVLQ